MRAKSLSGSDFLYVSLAFRQANIVAVSLVLAAGDAARLFEFCCPPTEDGIKLPESSLNSVDESGCDISWESWVFLAMAIFRTAPGIFSHLWSVAQQMGENMLATQAESQRRHRGV